MKARHWMQIAAVASAVGMTGTAIAHDTARTSAMDDTNGSAAAQLNGNATDTMVAPAPDNTVQSPSAPMTTPDYGTGNASTPTGNSSNATSSPSTIDNGATGTTQGSTMVSPKSDSTTTMPQGGARYGSGSSATSIGGSDRLGSTNSENFDQWASDYASQHNGRITRQEFLAQMENRWNQLDTQHRGYLTPEQMQEFWAVPEESAVPPRSGSDVQPGDMGPGSARSQ